VPADDRDGRIAWLYERWQELDAWIGEVRSESAQTVHGAQPSAKEV
jgi:hypothetical protein